MDYTIARLKTDLTGILHGTNLNKIQGLDELIERAASTFLLDCDPMETKRIVQLPLIYNQVYDYALGIPEDIKGNRIIDIRPQNYIRYMYENPGQRYNRMFDLFKGRQLDNIMFTVQHNTGVKSLRIDHPTVPPGIVLNSLADTNDNGTWNTYADATDLQVDYQFFATNASSLRYSLSGAGTAGGLTINMLAAVDLTNHENLSQLFHWVFFPDASKITSVTLQWGSDSTNYWTSTVTTNIFGNSFSNNWNLINFDWTTAAVVNNPNASSVAYMLLIVNYDGTPISGIRMDSVTSTLGFPYQIEYYSRFLFRDAITGAFQEGITNDTNFVNLETDTRNVFLYKVAELAIQQQHDYGYKPGTSEMLLISQLYQQHLTQYKRLYKSEVTKPTQQYYHPGRSPGSGFIGRFT